VPQAAEVVGAVGAEALGDRLGGKGLGEGERRLGPGCPVVLDERADRPGQAADEGRVPLDDLDPEPALEPVPVPAVLRVPEAVDGGDARLGDRPHPLRTPELGECLEVSVDADGHRRVEGVRPTGEAIG
jgi:hypothetical protein